MFDVDEDEHIKWKGKPDTLYFILSNIWKSIYFTFVQLIFFMLLGLGSLFLILSLIPLLLSLINLLIISSKIDYFITNKRIIIFKDKKILRIYDRRDIIYLIIHHYSNGIYNFYMNIDFWYTKERGFHATEVGDDSFIKNSYIKTGFIPPSFGMSGEYQNGIFGVRDGAELAKLILQIRFLDRAGAVQKMIERQ